MQQNKRLKGMIFVFLATVFWALSGTAGQYLFQQRHVEVGWLVSVRLLLSGGFILSLVFFQKKQRKNVLLPKKAWPSFLIFGIFAMMGVQFTYFASIEEGNVAMATLLQYLSPVFIILYVCIRLLKWPSKKEVIGATLAIIGTCLLLTNGSFSSFTIPLTSAYWGILSAVALAFYTLYSAKLLHKYGALISTGWSMLIGGVAISFLYPPYEQVPAFDGTLLAVLIFLVVFGTVIPFWLFVESMHYLTPTESSILASIEPLIATLITVVWLHEPFGMYQTIGMMLVISMVLILASKPKRKKRKVVKTIHSSV